MKWLLTLVLMLAPVVAIAESNSDINTSSGTPSWISKDGYPLNIGTAGYDPLCFFSNGHKVGCFSSYSPDASTFTFGTPGITRPYLEIHGPTSEGSDTGYLILGPGGANNLERGSAIVMYGINASNNAGDLKLDCANLPGAVVEIITPNGITHDSSDYKVRWYWQQGGGNYYNSATDGGDIVFQKDGTGVRESSDAPAAAGSDQTGAAALAARLAFVTGANGTAGVKLPVDPAEGTTFYVYNTANAILKVYPGSGDAISAAGLNNAVNVAAYGSLFCHAQSTSQWWCTEGANP